MSRRTGRAVLADGTPAEIRPARPADRPAVTELFDSCSEESLYTRFFTVGRRMLARHIDHLFDGGPDSLTYVLLRDERIIGIAEVERCDESTSEIAFLVADDAHGLGIATLLLERAAEDARASGVGWFIADVLAVNHPMLEVFADAGFGIERHPDHGDVALRMSTELTPAARSAIETRHAGVAARTRAQRDVGPGVSGRIDPTVSAVSARR